MATRRATLAPPAAAPAEPAKRARRPRASAAPSKPAKADSGTKREKRRKARIERRFHQRVQHIDVWSVLKMAICFYLCALVVILAAGTALWFIADQANAIHNVEKFLGEILDDKSFHLLAGEILRAATLIGLVIVCFATVMTVLAAAFYNLFSEIFGGVEITVVEDV